MSSVGRHLSSLQGYLCLRRRLLSLSCMALDFLLNSGVGAALFSHHPQDCYVTPGSTLGLFAVKVGPKDGDICQLINSSNTLIQRVKKTYSSCSMWDSKYISLDIKDSSKTWPGKLLNLYIFDTFLPPQAKRSSCT